MRGDIIHAERVKSPSIGRRKTAKQDPNEQTTGRIMLELSESIDADLIIAKQRDGAIGRAKLVFFPGTTKFTDRADDRFEKDGKR